MKKILAYTLTLVMFFGALAQITIDRTEKPEPGPSKEIKIGEYEKFSLKNGLTVVVVENNKIPRVSFQLIIDRDPLIENDKVGYVSMAGQILRRGTTNRTKDQIDEEIDFIGATLSTSSTSIYGSSLTKHSEKLLDLMTDVLYNPSFPEGELDKIKKQTISGLKANMDDPEAIAGNVASVLKYGKDHPYGEIQREEHVENITIDDLKTYYQTYFKPNISYLAIVGDISVKEAKKIAKSRFGKWESGDVEKITYDLPEKPKGNKVAIVNRSASVQTVLNITYPIELKPGSENFIKASVMNQVLGGSSASRLFKNIREDKAFTYGAYSNISSDRLVGTFSASASVRTEVTDSAVVEFLKEMERITKEPVEDDELQLAKNVLIGSFGRSLESPQTVAGFAVNLERFSLPADYYNNYVKNISEVTKEDILQIAQKYIHPDNNYILSVGKANEIEEGLKKFGELTYYDIYGNEVDPSTAKLPEGLTAEKVLDKYFSARGGIEKLQSIKSTKSIMSADLNGNKLVITQLKEAPTKLNIKIEVGGNVVNEQIYDGENAKVVSMGNRIQLNEEQKEKLVYQSPPIPELLFKNEEVKLTLTGVEEYNEKQVIGMEVTYPSEKSYTLYFDKETGLLVKQTETVETPQGDMTMTTEFLEYQETDGILFPDKVRIPLAPGMTVEAHTDLLEINQDIPDGTFEVK